MEVELDRLKRFDKSKHEQLEGLLHWCALMNLSGKDLVSLGGHIDRMQTRNIINQNRHMAESIPIETVGNDKNTDKRWIINTPSGKYRFEIFDSRWDFIRVISYKTKAKRQFALKDEWDIGEIHWHKRTKYLALLNYHFGHITLDF
jgi:hypothetical protein